MSLLQWKNSSRKDHHLRDLHCPYLHVFRTGCWRLLVLLQHRLQMGRMPARDARHLELGRR